MATPNAIPNEPTALAGTLIRQGKDAWRWLDGTPEPRVRDLSHDEWNFRCRTDGDRQTYVEVPRGLAQETTALAWVRSHPAGASWDTADQDAILGRARELGWNG